MPDVPEPHRRSRGPAAGRLWSGQAGPEAPPPVPPTEPPAPDSTFSWSAPEPQPESAAVASDRPARSPRIWSRALAGGAASGLAVAAVALAFGGSLLGGDTEPVTVTQPATVATTAGAKSQSAVGAIYAAASPAVASVQTGGGAGTGFLIDSDGTLVTNAHVVGRSSSVRVRFGDDGDVVTGRVAGTDTSTDLAVVKVDASDVSGISPLQFADSEKVKVGDLAVAIGNPLGLPQTATAGIVSGLQREIQAPNGFEIDKVIQTDAPINPGNSGGPLLNEQGHVVGVNSQIATAGAGGGNIGIGFAVPSNTAKEVVPQLQDGRQIERPWMGVSTAPAPGGGAQVAEVTPGSPAARAGLRPGDVILGVDGQRVREPGDVADAISDNQPGDQVGLEVRRSSQGGTTDVEMELGNRPAEGPR